EQPPAIDGKYGDHAAARNAVGVAARTCADDDRQAWRDPQQPGFFIRRVPTFDLVVVNDPPVAQLGENVPGALLDVCWVCNSGSPDDGFGIVRVGDQVRGLVDEPQPSTSHDQGAVGQREPGRDGGIGL